MGKKSNKYHISKGQELIGSQYYQYFRWFGIELDEPLGRHDGTVEDVRYFAAPDDHGVFVTEARLTKLHNQPPKPGKTISDEHESHTFSMN